MAEPWMSVQAPQSWPAGPDQFSTLHLSTPSNTPTTLSFTNVSSSIQWSQTWDVPQSQKNFAGSSMTKTTPMKVKNQVIEALAVGLAKMSIPDPEVPKHQEIIPPTQEEEEQTPKGISAKKKKLPPVVEEEEQPNIEDELQKQNLYKTELCRSFTETGICRYGHKCQFAHGGHELRPVLRHPKYKTEACKTFSITGQCPYGNRCRFIHQQHLAPQQQQQQQSQQSSPIPISSPATEYTWSTSWTNAGTASPSSASPSTAFAPQSSPSPNRGSPSANVSASPSPGSSPASQSSRDDNPRRLAFFQGLAN